MLYSISLRVLVVTSDMGAANRAVWRLLGFSSHRCSETVHSTPHPHLEDRQLYFMADPAHVLKNVRAQLLRATCFYLGENTVTKQGLPGSKVDISDVQAVVDHDSDSDLKIAHGLSAIHVSTGHFTTMKVGIAVQFFREAPPGIRYLIQKGHLPVEAEATAWFLELVWKWYTLMSSRCPVVALSKIDPSKYQGAVDTLMLAQDTLRHMKMGPTAHWKPSQAGLLISTSVVLSLAEELLSLRGYKYLLTSRLIQDCLENVFSIVRMKKPVPSAYDVKSSLKLICVGQFLHTPKSSSYDSDDGLHLADLLGASLEKSLEEFINDEEHLENLTLDEVSSVECDILAYVGGFLLKTIIKAIGECPPCTAVLLGDGQCYNALIELKEYVKGATNLLRPSAAVMELLVHYEEHFKGFVAEDAILDLKAPFRTISRFLANNVENNLDLCNIHREKVQKLLLERYVHCRLRMHLRQQRARHVETHSSKTCAGVNLQ